MMRLASTDRKRTAKTLRPRQKEEPARVRRQGL